jgi:hypothetical protein
MKRILIHLGLPKTATTSLQQNVFRQLHLEGVINFLGKDLDVDPKTGFVRVRSWGGKCIRDAAEEKIPFDAVPSLLEPLLSSEKLNVFSDEGLMVAYPGLDNVPLSRKLQNLNYILSDYDVSFIITLRNPLDYMYSLYVELYPSHCSQVKSLDTFKKYADTFLGDAKNTLFESFFYKDVLDEVGGSVDLTITFFEDLKDNVDSFQSAWASALCIENSKFKELFETKHRNQKKSNNKGRSKTFSFKVLENYLRTIAKALPFNTYAIKQRYLQSRFRKIIHYRFDLGSVHRFPSGTRLSSLEQALQCDRYEIDRRDA